MAQYSELSIRRSIEVKYPEVVKILNGLAQFSKGFDKRL